MACNEGNMYSKTRGFNWTDKELEVMLNLLYEHKAGHQVMTSTNLETATASLFEMVAESMKTQGFDRNFSQIRSRFKREKAIFYESLEEFGGLPPKDMWGPRFHLLNRLWEQAEWPDYRHRRRAANGKAKKRSSEQITEAIMGDSLCASSSAETEENSCQHKSKEKDVSSKHQEYMTDKNLSALLSECSEVVEENYEPSFISEDRIPSFEEMIKEFVILRKEVNQRKSNVNLKKGILRLKERWEQSHLEEALRKHADENESADGDDSESISDLDFYDHLAKDSQVFKETNSITPYSEPRLDNNAESVEDTIVINLEIVEQNHSNDK